MGYVNQHPTNPITSAPEPPRLPNVGGILARLNLRRLRTSLVIGLAALLLLLVALLAISPPYDGLAGFDLDPRRLLVPVQTYLFRNAVINTALLMVGVYLIALPIGWTWAVTGLDWAARPFLLLPIFIPGAVVGLLWRPFLAGWLDLADARLSLVVIALVMLWRAIPLVAWVCSWHRDAWPKLIPLTALLVLLDGDLVLTLTRGEPFNASHTWLSWIIQQLWTSRAWGYAASMAGALALVLAGLTWWTTRPISTPITTVHGSPIGLAALVIWLVVPFVLPLITFGQAPLIAITMLIQRGALLWLLNGALIWGGVTLLANSFTWRAVSPRQRIWARTFTLAMLPITLVALAYLTYYMPLLGNQWTFMLLASLLTTGLIMSDTLVPPTRRQQWLRVAGYAALVIVYLFPLQLVMLTGPRTWTPSLGTLWTLAEDPHAAPALSLALLLMGAWATLAAWLVTRGLPAPVIFEPLAKDR